MLYFIGINDFINKVPFSENVENSKIIPFIRQAQIEVIKPILGVDLYNELQEEMQANDISDTNVLLMPYIQDVHVYYSFLSFLTWAKFNITEYGLVIKNPSESIPISKEDVGALENWARSTGDSFGYELRNFLYENSTDYPLWTNCIYNSYNNNVGGLGWVNIGKNMTGKRISQQVEEIEKRNGSQTIDFYGAYCHWCNYNGYRL